MVFFAFRSQAYTITSYQILEFTYIPELYGSFLKSL